MVFTPLSTASQAQWHHNKRAMAGKGGSGAVTTTTGTTTTTAAGGANSLISTLRGYWHWGETRVASSIILMMLAGHFIFQLPALAPFLELQHAIPTEELREPEGGPRYQRGYYDYYYVIHWIVIFTFLRAATMQWVLRPIAHSQGVYSESKLQRFMEQGWLIIFYSISWSAGMWIMYNSKYWFNLDELWRDYPFNQLTSAMKHYYLIQLAFWWQQLIIVNVEEKRKDYGVMMAHHVITIILIMKSYYTHLTPVGNAILCCMDFADILLSTAKVFNYIKWQRTTDACFIVFLVGWVITRHGFFNVLTYSVYRDMPRFNLIQWDPSRHYYHTYGIYISYVCLLGGLELLCVYWFYLVIGIVRRVISGRKPEDTRSDSEGSDNEESTSGKSKKNKKKRNIANSISATANTTAVEAQGIASVQAIEETSTPRRSQRRR